MDIEEQRKLADISTEQSTDKKKKPVAKKSPAEEQEQEKVKSMTVVQKTANAVITIGSGSIKIVLDPKFGNIALIALCFTAFGFIIGALTNSETLEKSGLLGHIQQIIASIGFLVVGLVASVSNFLKQKVQKKISQGIDPENTIETNLAS